MLKKAAGESRIVICEAGTSNRGAIRSNSTAILPIGEVVTGAAEVEVEYAENSRPASLLPAMGLRPQQRRACPPTLLNIMAVCQVGIEEIVAVCSKSRYVEEFRCYQRDANRTNSRGKLASSTRQLHCIFVCSQLDELSPLSNRQNVHRHSYPAQLGQGWNQGLSDCCGFGISRMLIPLRQDYFRQLLVCNLPYPSGNEESC